MRCKYIRTVLDIYLIYSSYRCFLAYYCIPISICQGVLSIFLHKISQGPPAAQGDMSISLKQPAGSKKISRETLNFAENQTITVLTSEQKDHSPPGAPFRGHSKSDDDDPFSSGFHLADGPVEIDPSTVRHALPKATADHAGLHHATRREGIPPQGQCPKYHF